MGQQRACRLGPALIKIAREPKSQRLRGDTFVVTKLDKKSFRCT